MSKNLYQNRTFLELLLSTSSEQALVLLSTATKEQLLLLSEIFFNLLRLPLPRKAQYLVKKRKRLLERLVKAKANQRQRSLLVRKHSKFILQLLLSVKQQLNDLQ